MEKAMTGNQNDSTKASSKKKEHTAELTRETRDRLLNQAAPCAGVWWGDLVSKSTSLLQAAMAYYVRTDETPRQHEASKAK